VCYIGYVEVTHVFTILAPDINIQNYLLTYSYRVGLGAGQAIRSPLPYRCLWSPSSLRWRSPWLVHWVKLELDAISWTLWCSWACRGSDLSSSTSAEISSSRCRISLRTAELSASTETTDSTTGVTHTKSRTAPHCRVLPPGEFNDMISEPLRIYSVTFMTLAVRFSRDHTKLQNLTSTKCTK